MNTLPPLEALYDRGHGSDVPLPPDLVALYGRLQMPAHQSRPYVLGNFVSTLDGVVTLNMPGQSGGGPISGESPHDHLVMGLLRAEADAVIVGAGTLRAVSPHHRWTAEYIYPELRDVYQQLRIRLDKPGPPLNVIVTARGEINLDLPLFQSLEVPVLLVTTTQGEGRIRTQRVPPSVRIAALQGASVLSARAIVQAVCGVRPCQVILVEGGPRLLGNSLAEQVLDELFLTLAPQIVGRDASTERPGLVTGQHFAPEHPSGVRSSASNVGGAISFCGMRLKRESRSNVQSRGPCPADRSRRVAPCSEWGREEHIGREARCIEKQNRSVREVNHISL